MRVPSGEMSGLRPSQMRFTAPLRGLSEYTHQPGSPARKPVQTRNRPSLVQRGEYAAILGGVAEPDNFGVSARAQRMYQNDWKSSTCAQTRIRPSRESADCPDPEFKEPLQNSSLMSEPSGRIDQSADSVA